MTYPLDNWIKIDSWKYPMDERAVLVWPHYLYDVFDPKKTGVMKDGKMYYIDGDELIEDQGAITHWQHFPEGPITYTDYNNGLGESLLGFFNAVEFLAITIDECFDKTSVNEIKHKLRMLINNHLERVKRINP